MNTTLNRFDPTPLYMQLKNIIRDKISSGEWPVNSIIPSENELSKTYGISRMTVRSVITQFVNEGVLYRIQGKGTFVSEAKIEISSLHYIGIREQLEVQGREVSTRLISCTHMPANDFLSQKMGVPLGEELFKIKRVRATNGSSISYHKSYVPVALCPDLDQKDLQGEQLCKIMSSDYLLQRSRVVETMESYIADTTKAGYLEVFPGFPLILLEDQLYTADNTLYEYTRVYFRGDKIKVRIEYNV